MLSCVTEQLVYMYIDNATVNYLVQIGLLCINFYDSVLCSRYSVGATRLTSLIGITCD